MRRILLLTTITACVPPSGSWANWGSGGASNGASPRGTPSAPPVSPNLVATGAGKQLQRLTRDDTNNESEAVLSPDGRWLLYTSTVPGADGAQANRIMRSRADGRGGIALTKESGFTSSPAWLPNGSSYLAISHAMGSRDIVKALRVAPNAAMSRVLSGRDVGQPDAVEVSPDGRQLAFHSEVGGAWMINVARTDGSELTPLVPGAFPTWSPDGKRLAFHRHVEGRWRLFVTDAEGGELTQLTDGEADDEAATWSPDGKYVAFMSNRGWDRFAGATADGVRNLYVMRADGSGLVALTDGARLAATPHWGRDGKIYFSSTEGGTWDVWRIEPDLGALAAVE